MLSISAWVVEETQLSYKSGVGKLFFVKGHTVNILRFRGHEFFVLSAQPCHCTMKAAIDVM